MKKVFRTVKGTRDFYPEIMAMRTWLYKTLREVSESFGYQEYEAPILETLELYAAKSGDELVKEQSYVFSDRGGDMITLRPELTPSLARMVAQKQFELTFPLRWWSFGPFWRYEKPQKGRTREFFQWNVDIIGVNSPEADAENVAVLATFFRRVGLTPSRVLILVNNRRLIDTQLEKYSIPKEKWAAISGWIDKRDKLTLKDWISYGLENGLSSGQISNIQAMLEDKDLWKQSDELVRFFKAIEVLGIGEYVRFDASIMRGLLYYTGTVYEAWEVGGDIKRSILGGGRYDNLLAEVGGELLPGVGFAMGDVVILLILEKYGLLPEIKINPASLLVTVFNEMLFSESLKLATDLRNAGFNVICYPEPAKLPKQFKFADRMNVRAVLVIGPEEVEMGNVTIKDLASGSQETIPRGKINETISHILIGK